MNTCWQTLGVLRLANGDPGDGCQVVGVGAVADAKREELHSRSIDMRGYKRSDGLYEVEGRVVDRKSYDFVPLLHNGQFVSAGEPIHEMVVRLVYDERLVVRAIDSSTLVAPYSNCAQGGQALQSVVGLAMTNGWSKEVKKRLGGSRCCTHLMELLIPMATTAFQSLSANSRTQPERLDATGRPRKIDSCYAYSADGELVQRQWPEYFRASKV